MSRFVSRLGRNLLYGIGVIFIALAIGMAGYMYFGGTNLIDALVNASMILSGMGPVGDSLRTESIKIFAGFYVLVSGLLFVAVTGLILVPIFHRILHRFHVEEGEAAKRRKWTSVHRHLPYWHAGGKAGHCSSSQTASR
jgi:hypothetical protein